MAFRAACIAYAVTLLSCLPCRAATEELPASLSIDCGDGLTLELLLIKPGTFQMGSPENENGHLNNEALHTVTLTKPFYMGKHHVTQEQYKSLMGTNPSYTDGEKDPVNEVTWFDAVEFCTLLNDKAKGKLPAGMKIQLPTEAQWEYACRAGTQTRFYSGDADKDLDAIGWYSENSDLKTHPVGEKKANAFGLYDMHGNVWQWCQDAYVPHYEKLPAVDPFNAKGIARLLHGGSFLIKFPRGCRAAIRYGYTPADKGNVIGFRVAAASDVQKEEIAGKLKSDAAGNVVETKDGKETYELELSVELKKKAAELNGANVRVTGALEVRPGAEGKQRKIMVVGEIEKE
ncbi:MAG TPA: formylglycine-generating enzyme family protein [Planctomycetota bacterium]|nr:formylglycine-generating enzyme family protein [Planctomycetota bacterium]